jgi:hypothetical protein
MVRMCFGYFLHTHNFVDFGCHILFFLSKPAEDEALGLTRNTHCIIKSF